MKSSIFIFTLTILLSSGAFAKTYHISPHGDDSNDGSELHPWRSLSTINRLQPGDVAVLHGFFNEAADVGVSGSINSPITILGDDAVIDGTGIHRDAFVLRPNASYINIANLRITNFDHWGLALYGGNSHIKIENVEVSNCDAGIHLTAGYSGQQPLFGSVYSVTLDKVMVHDNAVSGLDCTPGPCYDISILNSSFYNNGVQEGFGADGIAIEVGNNILIRNTTSINNGGDGIDIGSRNPLFLSGSANVTVRECVIAYNRLQGLKLWSGGAAINCLIHSNNLEGLVLVYNGDYLVQHCDIVRNALEGGYSFTAGYPEPEPLGEQNSLKITIMNSIFAFNGQGDNPTGIWIKSREGFNSRNTIYYSRDFEEICFEDECVTRDQITSSGNNFGFDPLFVDLANNDFHLRAGSPAIDAGIPGVEIDLDFNPRPIGKGYDIGCYEYGGSVLQVRTPALTFTPTPSTSSTPGFEAIISIALFTASAVMRRRQS